MHAASPLTSSSAGLSPLGRRWGVGRPVRYFVHYIYSEDLHQQQTWTHTQTGTHTHTHITHTETHALPQLTRTHTLTDRDSYTHTNIDTHTQRPTHYLNSLDLTLHTEHLTDNSHSDFLRDEKCIRATRRLVSFSLLHPSKSTQKETTVPSSDRPVHQTEGSHSS